MLKKIEKIKADLTELENKIDELSDTKKKFEERGGSDDKALARQEKLQSQLSMFQGQHRKLISYLKSEVSNLIDHQLATYPEELKELQSTIDESLFSGGQALGVLLQSLASCSPEHAGLSFDILRCVQRRPDLSQRLLEGYSHHLNHSDQCGTILKKKSYFCRMRDLKRGTVQKKDIVSKYLAALHRNSFDYLLGIS